MLTVVIIAAVLGFSHRFSTAGDAQRQSHLSDHAPDLRSAKAATRRGLNFAVDLKWLALLCAIFAVIMALWSLAMIGEMIGSPPAKAYSKPPAQTPASKQHDVT